MLVVALLAGLSGIAAAVQVNVYGPICDPAARITSTTYYNCAGATHTALDISGVGTCGVSNYHAALGGSYRYGFFGGCANSCSGCAAGCCNGGAGNYYVVTGASGWDFRQLHFNTSAASGTKTCDRCVLGLLGATGASTGVHAHLDNRQYGTRKSAWYTTVGTTCGSNADCGVRIGVVTL